MLNAKKQWTPFRKAVLIFCIVGIVGYLAALVTGTVLYSKDLISDTAMTIITVVSLVLLIVVALHLAEYFRTCDGSPMQVTAYRQKIGKIYMQIVIYAFLTVVAIAIIFPFYWMIISSLKTLNEYNEMVPTLFPREIVWENYLAAFETKFEGKNIQTGQPISAGLLDFFVNTVIVGVSSTALSLVVTVLSAFAFARLEFKGKNALFAALLATMMIPGELFTITNFATVYALDWRNTYQALIFPFLVSVFYIYLLRQNFMQIPNELYLAAKVDGTSDLKYLWKVMIPLAMPTLISITILKMMGAWNSYVWPRLVANDGAHSLITNGLMLLSFKDPATEMMDYPKQMAAVTLVSIPLFLVFIFLRKYIMKGVSRSGIKG